MIAFPPKQTPLPSDPDHTIEEFAAFKILYNPPEKLPALGDGYSGSATSCVLSGNTIWSCSR